MIENDIIILNVLDDSRDEFISGIDDEELCHMYGIRYPVEGDRLFNRFSGISDAFGVFRKIDGIPVGFVLSVEPEIPEKYADVLPANGRTLAYATFPQYQRRGYMHGALRALIDHLFANGIDFIHCGRFDFNDKSAALLDKLGFKTIGAHQFKEKTIIDEILIR